MREIVRVPEITAVPNAPELIEGVINLARQDYSGDGSAKTFRQLTRIQSDKKNRILVVELENRLLGLDRQLGLRSAEDSAIGN